MKIAIPTVITVGLCFVLLTGVDFDEMVSVIRRECSFGWIILALCLSVVSMFIRAWRWKLQLNALNIFPGFFVVLLSIFGTYGVNIVFPRLGEIWRTGYIAARQEAPFTKVFGSMVADRIADIVLVGLLAVVTFCLATPAIVSFVAKYPDAYRTIISFVESPLTWGCVLALLLIGMILYIKYSQLNIIAKIKTAALDLWRGFAVVFVMPRRILWIFLSFALWGCYFMQFYLCFFAFPFTEELLADNGVICALVGFVLSSIAMGIPSNGGLGPWQIAVIFALTLYSPVGMNPADAEIFRLNITAFANLVIGSETLLMIILGIFTFITIGLSKHKSSNNIKGNQYFVKL